VAWHRANTAGSRVLVRTISTGRRVIVAKSEIALLANPAITSSRIVWVDLRSGSANLRMRSLTGTRVSTLWSFRSRARAFWTTALAGRSAFVTRWSVTTGAATLYRVNF
jgi:hypothetical protein